MTAYTLIVGIVGKSTSGFTAKRISKVSPKSNLWKIVFEKRNPTI